MNYTQVGSFRADLQLRTPHDDQSDRMEQIRDLLVGELRREMSGMLARLEQRVIGIETELQQRMGVLEARIDQLETSVYRGNGALESRVRELDSERRATFVALSEGVADLAQRVRRLSEQ